MNIFILDKNIKKCAQYHCDKHVVKMILETAQLLCSAHHVTGGSAPYKLSHKNHPCSIWVRSSLSNYLYLCELGLKLGEEYTHRYGRIHATARLIEVLYTPPTHIPIGVGFTEPTPAMPDEYKITGNSVRSYINYYVGAKKHLASWKKRQTPEWFTYA